MKNILSKIINALSIVVIIAAVGILASVLLSGGTQPSIMGYSMFRVLTNSMEPAIATNSVIITKKTAPSELAAGDVISFRSSDPLLDGAANTHRIIAVDTSGAEPVFMTKGDNNAVADEYPVYAEAVIGKVVFVSHILGTALALLSNPIFFVIVIILPLAVIFILNIRDLLRAAKKLSDAELEALANGKDPEEKD